MVYPELPAALPGALGRSVKLGMLARQVSCTCRLPQEAAELMSWLSKPEKPPPTGNTLCVDNIGGGLRAATLLRALRQHAQRIIVRPFCVLEVPFVGRAGPL